jgi:hypothetical protein
MRRTRRALIAREFVLYAHTVIANEVKQSSGASVDGQIASPAARKDEVAAGEGSARLLRRSHLR